MRILLIDDDEDDYVMTRDLLAEIDGTQMERMELEWASTYEAGLKAMERNGHDVYLLDYRLGERNGLELLAESAACGCKGPIIVLTGQADRAVDVEAMKAGAADYLVKGRIDAALLERSIRYAIGHKRSKDQILQIAYYDHLTNLPNRVLFQDRLKQGMDLAGRHERITAVLFLDLDNFKRINDTLGHRIGDLLLKGVADRLTESVRKSDSITRGSIESGGTTIARLGGDEFTVLLTEISHIHDAAKVAQRFLDTLSRPFVLDGHEVVVTASVGIAVYPLDGKDMDALLKNADTAMYHAKEQGRNNYQFYRREMNAAALEKLTLENDLRKALDRNEFVLYYQPQINIPLGAVVGMEALIRWQHPKRGMVPPAQFIPLAEETNLIIPIGEWVLRTACAHAKAWQAAGFSPVPVSVNLSSQQFKQHNIVDTAARALSQSGLEPRCLILEITESILVQDTDEVIAMLRKLTAMGVRIAIDDFGIGYSSLSYLKRFPLYAVKIDRSFVKGINTNPNDAAIATAIIAMAHSLQLRAVAEGVETEDQLRFIAEKGCDEMQGYLLSRPVPFEEASKLLMQEQEGAGIGGKLCTSADAPAPQRIVVPAK